MAQKFLTLARPVLNGRADQLADAIRAGVQDAEEVVMIGGPYPTSGARHSAAGATAAGAEALGAALLESALLATCTAGSGDFTSLSLRLWSNSSAPPITDAMSKAMLGAHRIHTDDTGIAVLAAIYALIACGYVLIYRVSREPVAEIKGDLQSVLDPGESILPQRSQTPGQLGSVKRGYLVAECDPGPTEAAGPRDAINSLGRPDTLLVDLRETSERAKHGMLSGALHAPYPSIEETALTVDSFFSNVDPLFQVDWDDHATGWWYTWRGSQTGGHYSRRQGKIDNCILKWGCIGTHYPQIEVWVNGNGEPLEATRAWAEVTRSKEIVPPAAIGWSTNFCSTSLSTTGMPAARTASAMR